ncbi:OmpP1/FadL family transporter [Marinobacter xestospongiae]|uniref:Outer membrane protein transport protein n=1 Tax=Marinobacter xestospongiae TaxID=994319 RepID=A0ABU3VWX0_9GAMM|nr:outer membrane protein transport protein [Marinobacter xestospongiae]MDV2078763.1 outer membrane protein transport protein [Marinobacter xestospongiae]
MYKTTRYLVSAALISAPVVASAGGFSLNEQSASAMGVANAGAAANPENATTVFFNPAGMSQLEGNNLSFGAAILNIDAELDRPTGSATGAAGAPVDGSSGGDFAPLAVLPNLYMTYEVNDSVDVGFGIHAPYGLSADYDNDFVGRYFADKTELTAIAFTPSIALNDGNGFSMGFGANLIYAEGRLSKFQDYSQNYQQAQASGYGGPAFEEGYFDVEGDDIAMTFTFGLLWEVSDRTQFGLTAQTGTELELEGEATLTNVPVPQIGAGGLNMAFTNLEEDARVPLEIPESISVGARHQLTDSVTLLAGATWAKWSRFVALDIESREQNGAISSGVGAQDKYGRPGMIGHVSENWNDTWQANVGVIWQASPAWAFKAGYAYDQTPVDEHYRTARIPSDDRQWLTLGTQYADAGSGWTVDVAAGVLLFDDVDVDEREYTVDDEPIANAARFQGTYELDAWGASVQVSKQF